MLRIGRQMKVSEQNLIFVQHPAFVGLWLLDLDDHVGALKDFLRRLSHAGARRFIILVGQPNLEPGMPLHHNIVAMLDDFAHTARRQTDPMLERFDFLWHTDPHWPSPEFRCPTPCRLRQRRIISKLTSVWLVMPASPNRFG